MNYLVCWQEDDRLQKWDVLKEKDHKAFIVSLIRNKNVKNNSVFVIPASAILGAIWLIPEEHKSNRVDFYNFHEDYGIPYQPPKTSEVVKKIVSDHEDKYGDNTKYGWISPQGKYYHCNYQGHSNLADRICFGMEEDIINSDLYLEEHGWCKVFKSPGVKKYCVYVGGNHVITDAQMRTLIKNGLDKAEGITEMLCKE